MLLTIGLVAGGYAYLVLGTCACDSTAGGTVSMMVGADDGENSAGCPSRNIRRDG